MKKSIMVHTTDVRVTVLRPSKPAQEDTPCICFSENLFIPYFGNVVYLFNRETLEKAFHVVRLPTAGIWWQFRCEPVRYVYRSQPLQWEYRVYEPIDVERYAIGVIDLFDVRKGELEVLFNEEVIRRETIRLGIAGSGK